MLQGMTKEDLDRITLDHEGWRESDKFEHTCGAPALLHSHTNWICGCRPCKLITYEPAINFRERTSAAV